MDRFYRRVTAAVAASFFLLTMAGAASAAEAPGGPLALDECIDIALGGHPKVKAAEQDLEAGEHRTTQAISGFWPWASFEASRNYTRFARQIRIGGASITTTADYVANNFTFNTNWTFFDFGRTYYKVRGLAELEDSLTSDLTATEQSIAFDVVDAYFSLLQAQSLVNVAEESMAASRTHLEHARAFYDVGVKPRFDVTQAEVELNDAKLQLIVAKDAVKLARVRLNTVLGFAPSAPTEVLETRVAGKLNGSIDDYVDKAMGQRPELKSLEFAQRSASAGVKGAYTEFLPSLSAGATQNWYKEDHTEALSNQDLVISVRVPIFEGFSRTAGLGVARANALAAGYRLEDAKRNVTLEVSSAYLDVEDAAARTEALVSSVEKARENLDIAQGRYEAGVGPLIEVTDAQVALTSALTDKARADFDYNIAYARLLKSIGTSVKGQGLTQ